MENSESPDEIESTPGQRLREAREAAGISPREMADRLNWLLSHVAAIEDDRFEELKGAAFVRGYLRAYARAVDLDEDEMVALYAALHPEAPEPAGQAAAAPPASAISQPTGMSVVVGVAVAVVVIGAIWLKQGSDDQPPAQATSAPASTTAEKPAAEAAEATVAEEPTAPEAGTAVEAQVVSPPAAETVEPQPVVEAQPEPEAQPEQPEAIAAAEVAEPVVEVEAATPAASPVVGPEGALQFSFSGDCWLEVRDGEGQLIYADLRRAGDTLGLDGIAPFEILAGDAAAITLLYQGEPVAIRTRPGRDTARFTVGEP